MLLTVDVGKMSSGISLLSGLGDAMGSPLSDVVLYRSPSPRTISCPACAIEMPVSLLTPSATLPTPLTAISRAPMFSMAAEACLRSIISVCSASRFLRVTTATSSICLSSALRLMSRVSTPSARPTLTLNVCVV